MYASKCLTNLFLLEATLCPRIVFAISCCTSHGIYEDIFLPPCSYGFKWGSYQVLLSRSICVATWIYGGVVSLWHAEVASSTVLYTITSPLLLSMTSRATYATHWLRCMYTSSSIHTLCPCMFVSNSVAICIPEIHSSGLPNFQDRMGWDGMEWSWKICIPNFWDAGAKVESAVILPSGYSGSLNSNSMVVTWNQV